MPITHRTMLPWSSWIVTIAAYTVGYVQASIHIERLWAQIFSYCVFASVLGFLAIIRTAR